MRNATAFYHRALGKRIPFLIIPFAFWPIFTGAAIRGNGLWWYWLAFSMDRMKKKHPPAVCWLRRKKRCPVLSELCVDRSAMISGGKKDLTSACFAGLLTRRLSAGDAPRLPTGLRLADVPWRGFWLPTVSKTGTHVQPPAVNHQEKAEFAGWEGSWDALPSPEAELQRTVQVSPDLSLQWEVKFSSQPVLITVESRFVVTSCCSLPVVFRKTLKINWMIKTVVTRGNKARLKAYPESWVKAFWMETFFFQKNRGSKISHIWFRLNNLLTGHVISVFLIT